MKKGRAERGGGEASKKEPTNRRVDKADEAGSQEQEQTVAKRGLKIRWGTTCSCRPFSPGGEARLGGEKGVHGGIGIWVLYVCGRVKVGSNYYRSRFVSLSFVCRIRLRFNLGWFFVWERVFALVGGIEKGMM